MDFEKRDLQCSNIIEQEKDLENKKRELFKQTSLFINAGGKGTRMESVFPKSSVGGVTKALIEFNGKPMVQYHVDLLMKFGFRNVIIGAGDHLNIRDYFEERESDELRVINTRDQEGTGGDLVKAIRETNLFGDNVLVENVDTVLMIKDVSELLLQHVRTGAVATIALTTRKGVPNEGAFFVDADNKVVFSMEGNTKNKSGEPKEWAGFRGSSTGVVIFKTDALRLYNWKTGSGSLSIYEDILPVLIEQSALYAYNNEHNMFTDTGTPDAYYKVKRREKKLFGALEDRYMKQIKK